MTLFTDKAPWVMNLLMRDFPEWGPEDAAADLGNAGHECAGFTDMVEVDARFGGKGGIGWFQWTGQTATNPRRRDFEAYCRKNGLDRFGDEANYNYHLLEMKGPEKKAVAATAAAMGLSAKVQAFEKAYERAGVKNYPSRLRYAEMALKAWRANPTARPPADLDRPDIDPPPTGDPILRKGDGIKADDPKRLAVMEAQTLIGERGFPVIVDGKFGLVTEAKVIALQKIKGLDPDGVIGPATWAVLRAAPALAAVQPPTPARQPDDPGPGMTNPYPPPAPSAWQRFVRWLFGLN